MEHKMANQMSSALAAVEDFTEAIRLKPDYADAYRVRGQEWLYLHEWDKAEDVQIPKDLAELLTRP